MSATSLAFKETVRSPTSRSNDRIQPVKVRMDFCPLLVSTMRVYRIGVPGTRMPYNGEADT